MSFDFIAPYYDRLAKLVFGDRLIVPQISILDSIPDGSTILLIGGGNGEILDPILQKLSPKRVVYLDSSIRMTSLARDRYRGVENLDFQTASVFDWDSELKFDLVITPFFLDMFTADEIEKIVQRVSKIMNTKASWINVDFVAGDIRQTLLLKMMYLFFGLVAGLKASNIVDPFQIFKKNGFRLEEKQEYFRPDLIASKWALK